MKTLLLMRHAHAADGFAGGAATDFDRPLSDRGAREADAAGAKLRAAGLVPGVILASAAVRTADTARRVAAELFRDDPANAPPVQLLQELYGGTPADHRAALAACGAADVVLLVAHNPGVADHLARLTGEPVPCPPATCGVCELNVAGWGALNDATTATAFSAQRP